MADEEGAALALELLGLTKVYDGRAVVEQLGLSVPRGTLFGLVGPNGAGKTTTLAMATGLLRPDGGTARVLGVDVWEDPPAAKRLMGVAPDGMRLFDQLTGRELLLHVGALRRLPAATVAERTEELLSVLGLSGDGGTVVADYSAGMLKKIGLACALLHDPGLLVLDEPFEAVDPVSGQAVRTILRRYVAAGGTVVMSSHVMELVEDLCSHVAVIVAGQVLATGSTTEVAGGLTLHDRFLHLVGAADVGRTGLSWLGSSSG